MQTIVRDRLNRRGDLFLELADRAIFTNARSPYLRLLAHAGCTRGDLRALVQREGLEGALAALAASGVYVAFDELKGRRPIVRGSLQFRATYEQFSNPLQPAHLIVPTGGSGGRRSPVRRSLADARDNALGLLAAVDAHGMRNVRHVLWGATPQGFFKSMAVGLPVIGWFYATKPIPQTALFGLKYLATVSRMYGATAATPSHLDVSQPARMARWLHARQRPDSPILVTAYASSAVRACLAAAELGLTLPHVVFEAHGEPFTEARRAAIVAAGARAIVRYGSTEIPSVGYGCASPRAVDDVHVAIEKLALTVRKRAVPDDTGVTESLILTSLLPTTPLVALNVELGDRADVSQRACECASGTLGLTQHLENIRSFEKLTGEGVTFALTDVLRILEERLPARFGGSLADYQLAERFEQDGITRMELRIATRLPAVREDDVKAEVLRWLGEGSLMSGHMANVWTKLGTLTVVRQDPTPTAAGKVLPFMPARAAVQAASG